MVIHAELNQRFLYKCTFDIKQTKTNINAIRWFD